MNSTVILGALCFGLFFAIIVFSIWIMFSKSERIQILNWVHSRKLKPVKQMPKYLDLMFKVIERQREAEWEENQIKRMKRG